MNMPSDIVPYLQQVPPLDQLPLAALELVAKNIQVSYHVRGDALGEYNTQHNTQATASSNNSDKLEQVQELLLIRSGAVALHQSGGAILEQRSEGELFGHGIHFDGQQRAYSALTAEDALIWLIPTSTVRQLCQQHSGFQDWLLGAPGDRLHAQADAVVRNVGDLPLRQPVTAPPQLSIQACAQQMNQHRVSSLPILDDRKLVGILTDRDLRARVVACGIDLNTAVSEVMTPKPVTAHPEDSVDDALVVLLRHGIHHLPVVADTEQGEELHGIVTAGDLLRIHSPHPLRLVRDISKATHATEVARLARQGPELLAKLAGELKDVSQIGRIAGLITDACTKRFIQLAEKSLGPAPMAYTWLAFGSQARLEQGLVSDQDNGLLLAEKPNTEAAEYFEQFTKQVCDGLAECGYTYCKGGVMAMGQWRLSVDQWRKTFEQWIDQPDPKSVMHCSIFFDMRPVHGDIELAEELRQQILHTAKDNRIFLRFLAAESLNRKPPLGFFRQFVQEHGGDHSHGLNLKQRGVIPVVDLARVLALEGAISEVHSEKRLLAAAQAGLTTAKDAANLIQAQRFISRIRLEHQIRQLEQGQPLNHLVDPAELSSLHRRYLRSAFNVVRSAQQALAQRFMI
jgi:CBS domain-containing protein